MSEERTWRPGDGPVLPDADETVYPPDAVPLPVKVRRPLRCRWGWHAYADSTLDRQVGNWEFWETHCKRCGALVCYSDEPFMVNGKRAR